MMGARNPGAISRTCVDYDSAWELQLSMAWSWMGHAPAMVAWRYRDWHDEEDATAACCFTHEQAESLHRSKPMQEELCAAVDERLHAINNILEDAERRGDGNVYWLEYNEAIRRAAKSILPRLRRVQRNFDSVEVADCEEKWLQWRR